MTETIVFRNIQTWSQDQIGGFSTKTNERGKTGTKSFLKSGTKEHWCEHVNMHMHNALQKRQERNMTDFDNDCLQITTHHYQGFFLQICEVRGLAVIQKRTAKFDRRK